jgi:hypothetical protein
MKRFILTYLLALLIFTGAYAEKLSPMAQISLLTCDPGKELYIAFGHSAVRVSDPATGIDYVFNYGTFSFATQNFYVKFVRGKLDYQLSVARYTHFIAEYIEENRSIRELILNLSQTQKQAVYDFLVDNYQPENRFYKYDFFYDNCATRIRDIFPKVLKDSFQYNGPKPAKPQSFRDLTDSYLVYSPWSNLGINLALGMPTDKIMSFDNYMFLPDYLEKSVENAVIYHNGKPEPFVARKQSLFTAAPETQTYYLFRPWTVFALVLIILLFISYIEQKKNKTILWFDGLIFSIVGWLGMLLVFLWTATDHQAAYRNWNLLWAMPFHIYFAFSLFKNKITELTRKYFLAYGVLTLIVFIMAMADLFPQRFDKSLALLMIALSFRSLKIGWKQKN